MELALPMPVMGAGRAGGASPVVEVPAVESAGAAVDPSAAGVSSFGVTPASLGGVGEVSFFSSSDMVVGAIDQTVALKVKDRGRIVGI